jgi:hypothetical protein
VKKLAAAPILLLLGACQQEGVPVPEKTTDPAPQSLTQPSAASLPLTAADKIITFDPIAAQNCSAIEVTAGWDASKMGYSGEKIELWVADGAQWKLFAGGGNKGQAQTGPWVKSGTAFQLRSPGNPSPLAEARFPGPPC